MSEQQKAFFSSPGNVTVESIFPRKVDLKKELVRMDGMIGVLDPLPNANLPIRKGSKIGAY